ncbi:MAG: hypothetical protein Q9195_006883 [Heterodermia aff. obscurata]
MAFVPRVLDAMGVGDEEDQSIELQHRYASLLNAYNELKIKHDQLLATHKQNMPELLALREFKPALQSRNAVLHRELQACKDDLFRVQPTSQVPDSTIAEHFESLDARICDWIEAATIRTWRSEALTSLAKTPEFSAQLQKAKNRLTIDMFDQLAVVFPIIDHGQASLDTFYSNIIKPAVELALIIQTSTSSYRFEPRMSSNPITKPCKISRKDLGSFRMTDVETGKTLKPESPVRPDCDGDIGIEMIVLKPGLLRFDADKSVPLSQEAILIKLYHPLGRRRAVTVEPEKKDESARQ